MNPRPAIVVADRDRDTRFLIRVYLRDHGIDIIEAEGRGECLEQVKNLNPAAAIINFMFEGVTGQSVAGEILEKSPGVPVIIMVPDGFDLFAEHPGVRGYLVKPFTRIQLLEIIEKILGPETHKLLRTSGMETPSNENGSEKSGNTGSAEKLKILAADDEENIRILLKVMLKGYAFETAGTGEELVRKGSESRFDLIITDIVMPGMSGWKAVGALRERGINTPVVFNSGLVRDKELYETLRPEGASRFILKPFKKEELLSAVSDLLGT